MFIERLSQNFGKDVPIFTEEIIKLFNDYSRAQVFRYIESAKEKKEIIQYSKGVYYIPHTTILGTLSTISVDSIITKRYLSNQNKIYGIYSGIKLLNSFSLTTQMATVIEIVTNNEKTRCREIIINERKYILRKSRCEINKKNYASYMIMQFFNDIASNEKISNTTKRHLLSFIKDQNVTSKELFDMALYFPAKATKSLIGSGIINATL